MSMYEESVLWLALRKLAKLAAPTISSQDRNLSMCFPGVVNNNFLITTKCSFVLNKYDQTGQITVARIQFI